MNKVTRLLGSTVLAAGLTFGSVGAANAAFADGNNTDRGYGSSRHDDRGYDRDHRNHHYLYICFDRHGHYWFEWGERYDHKRNCYVIRTRY
jgi:hypothetical protein